MLYSSLACNTASVKTHSVMIIIAKIQQRANIITIVKVNYYIAGLFCGKKDFREQLGITELS